MKRAFAKSPLAFSPVGTFILVTLFLTGGKILAPGEVMWQEGVRYRVEGHQLQQQGNLEQAATAYRKAVTLKPDYAEAYNDLGVVLESMGDFAGAEEAYKNALVFKPTLGSAHSNLALLYEETNRVKEAAVHWGARVQMGPPNDPWVVKAREKLTHYQLAVPETAAEKTEKRAKEIRLAIETGKAHLEAKQFDQAISEFERALKMDPTSVEATRLLRSAKTRAEQAQAHEGRELEAAKGRVKSEAVFIQREQAARKAENERERVQREQTKTIQKRTAQQSAKQLKELEEARRKAAVAESKAQKAESERTIETAKRIEAEKRAEEIEKRAAADEKIREKEKAARQVEEAKKRSAEADRRAEIARKAADAARMAAAAADQTYQAARQTVEAAKETEAMVKQTEIERPVKVAPPPAKAAAPEPASTASPQAQAIAQEIIKQRSQVRGKTSNELNRRAVEAMREGRYQDAVEVYKQSLTLDPSNRSAKQGLERAQKALAKETQ